MTEDERRQLEKIHIPTEVIIYDSKTNDRGKDGMSYCFGRLYDSQLPCDGSEPKCPFEMMYLCIEETKRLMEEGTY